MASHKTAVVLVPLLLLVGACRSSGAVPPTACSRIATAQVVAVGESHDKAEHHMAERDALLCMLRGSKPVLLGLEMFQRPYQAPLDDYVAGRIDENEMLRRTEYFTRWKFDWTLYAPLWRAAKENGVRIVALNTPAEIATKIGRQGLDSLTLAERLRIAETIDLTVPSHQKRIRGYFSGGGAHAMSEARIGTLYEAQTTWDETMAESAAKALAAAGPDARMLVVAGSFHVQEFDGIPNRIARRRPGFENPLVVVLREPDREDDVPDAQLGDIVLRPRIAARPSAPLLGIAPGASDGAGLPVIGVVPGGPAASAGLQSGDVITSLAGKSIRDMTDFRYVLDPLAPGDRTDVSFTRDGVLHQATVALGGEAAAKP